MRITGLECLDAAAGHRSLDIRNIADMAGVAEIIVTLAVDDSQRGTGDYR